jgi:large conductance mechanosensitive channel
MIIMWQEFKKFIMRGNVMDLAVGVVIGAAFGAIVNSFVNDIIMPVIGFLTAGISFTDLKIKLKDAVMANDVVVNPEVAITYGKLIQVAIQFLIVALFVFLVVKAINKMRERADARKPKDIPPPVAKPADVILLEEIRDLLKKDRA